LAGFSSTEIHDVRQRLKEDVDTYYLAAEGHNMWRGSLSYEECALVFPFTLVSAWHQ